MLPNPPHCSEISSREFSFVLCFFQIPRAPNLDIHYIPTGNTTIFNLKKLYIVINFLSSIFYTVFNSLVRCKVIGLGARLIVTQGSVLTHLLQNKHRALQMSLIKQCIKCAHQLNHHELNVSLKTKAESLPKPAKSCLQAFGV